MGNGFVDLVIKVYFKGTGPKNPDGTLRFPEGGILSQHMESMKIGDPLNFQGPKGSYEYRGRGVIAIKQLRSQGGGFRILKVKKLGMIAGGTGITPMLQIMQDIDLDKG